MPKEIKVSEYKQVSYEVENAEWDQDAINSVLDLPQNRWLKHDFPKFSPAFVDRQEQGYIHVSDAGNIPRGGDLFYFCVKCNAVARVVFEEGFTFKVRLVAGDFLHKACRKSRVAKRRMPGRLGAMSMAKSTSNFYDS